ncbi:MAG: hypothetical protein ABW167_07665 [Baekduia sp.]
MSSRREIRAVLEVVVRNAFGAEVQIGPVNWGDSHRRMLLYNRRHERAYRRSRRNQPPRSAR